MPYFKTENGNAENIKYDNTKSVKEAIDDIKDTAMFIDSFDTDTGTLNTTSVSSSSSSDPTASSVTFDNTDTGLNATNVQDAVTEVNGKYETLDKCIGLSIVGTGTIRIHPNIGDNLITKEKLLPHSGTLPPTSLTVFTVISQSGSCNRYIEVFYDGDKLHVYTNVSQDYTIRWFSFATR